MVTESTLDNNNDWRAECSALRDENRKLRKRLEAVEALRDDTIKNGFREFVFIWELSDALKDKQERGTGR